MVNQEERCCVIMSVYKNDRLDYVKQSVNSILNQTFTNIDVFIQYDGYVPLDIDNFLTQLSDNRLHIQRRDENKGLAYSLNELLRLVMPLGYEFIARMDADDVAANNRLEKQIRFLQSHPDIDCVGTWAIEIDAEGNEYYKKQMPISHNECLQLFRKRDCMIHPTVMFRRSYIEKAGFYALDTYFGEDTMMWAQGFANGCQFANLPEYLLQFRLDNNFFQRRRGWKHAKSIFLLRHKVNRLLHFGLTADIWALAYAAAKMQPTFVLNFLYKHMRKV
ncbi:MAG: glycosyltransferase [Paludibacter sp.]|nr:glycosyltransferase [Bacteroidales bacterium]MCM1069880.1 glycosyltransferase [Prevotella sp.]MCM1354561.1 glycosyltransferase [Bacteroides sp.]MCM1443456.1 glycosyltransferase [Muribaculum sp.]MCM1482540.1 glycosyltransferase [Paludibacter sp.]